MAQTLSIPDDIIQLIVDEIANAHDLPTLRACATVSWAMNHHARKHLFSDIHFLLDNSASCYRRAKRLVHLLKDPRNQDLHTRIRSLTIVVGGTATETTRAVIQKSKASLVKAFGNLLSPTVDYITVLFQLLAMLPFTAFTLKPQPNTEDLETHSQTVIVHWSVLCGKSPVPSTDISGLIHELACKPGLESLTFRWIWGMPVSLLVGRDYSTPLRRLNVHRSAFNIPEGVLSADDLHRFTTRVSEVKALTLITQAPFLQFVCMSNYPNLRTATVNIPSQTDELSRLLSFLSTAAPTLTSLTVQNLASFGSSFANLSSDYLGDFSSLEHLKYTTKVAEATQLLTRIGDIAKLLQSARKPMNLQSIAIHFQLYCSRRSQTWIWDALIHSRRPETASDPELTNRWAMLDAALSSRHFAALKRVRIHFTFFMYHSTNFDLPESARPSLELVLPEIHARPALEVGVTSEKMAGSSAHEMWALGSDEGQGEDENVLWQP